MNKSSNMKTKTDYKALYENLSKRISALHKYADVFKVDIMDDSAVRRLRDYISDPSNIHRKLKDIAWGRGI